MAATGRFAHTMDAKGRIAIPERLRVEITSQDQKPPVLAPCVDAPAIAIYPGSRWEEIEQKLGNLPGTYPEVQQLRRLLSSAEDCPIDAQGRLRVPQPLREHARLSRLVTISRQAGGSRIEIWDRARFEEDIATADGQQISRVVADLTETRGLDDLGL